MCRGDSSYSNLYFLTTFYGHEIQLSFRHERLKIYCYIWLHLSWKKLSRSSRGQTGILILLSNILDYVNFWWFIVIYSLSTHYLMITQLQYKDILIYLKKYCAFLSFLPLTTPTTPTMDSLSCLSSRFSSPDSSSRELIFSIDMANYREVTHWLQIPGDTRITFREARGTNTWHATLMQGRLERQPSYRRTTLVNPFTNSLISALLRFLLIHSFTVVSQQNPVDRRLRQLSSHSAAEEQMRWSRIREVALQQLRVIQ